MSQYRLPFWLPLVVLFLVGVFAFVVPAWTTTFVELGKLSGISSDWAGFAGSLISAIMTVAATGFAAFFAWIAISRQIRMEGLPREEERMEMELPNLREAEKLLSLTLKKIDHLDTGKIGHFLDVHKGAVFDDEGQPLPSIYDQIQQNDERTRYRYRFFHRIVRFRKAWRRRAEGATKEKNGDDDLGDELTLAQIEYHAALEDLRRLGKVLTRKVADYDRRLPKFRAEIEQHLDD